MKQRTGFVSNSSSCSFAISKHLLTEAQIAELLAWSGSQDAWNQAVEETYGDERAYNQMVNDLHDFGYDKDTDFFNDYDYGSFSPNEGTGTLSGTCSQHSGPSGEWFKEIGLDPNVIDWSD